MTITLLVNVSFGKQCCDLSTSSLMLAYQVLPTCHSCTKGNKTNLPSKNDAWDKKISNSTNLETICCHIFVFPMKKEEKRKFIFCPCLITRLKKQNRFIAH